MKGGLQENGSCINSNTPYILQSPKFNLFLASLIAFFITIIFIEGKVYVYGALSYFMAALLEIGLFIMGFLVAKTIYEK